VHLFPTPQPSAHRSGACRTSNETIPQVQQSVYWQISDENFRFSDRQREVCHGSQGPGEGAHMGTGQAWRDASLWRTACLTRQRRCSAKTTLHAILASANFHWQSRRPRKRARDIQLPSSLPVDSPRNGKTGAATVAPGSTPASRLPPAGTNDKTSSAGSRIRRFGILAGPAIGCGSGKASHPQKSVARDEEVPYPVSPGPSGLLTKERGRRTLGSVGGPTSEAERKFDKLNR
jgi:hypothetical protein